MRIAAFFSYGFESETFIRCRQNWAFYTQYHRDVDCYFFRETESTSDGSIQYIGQDYLVPMDEGILPSEKFSTYDSNAVWTSKETRRTLNKWTRALEYIISRDSNCWIIYCNITAFFSFGAIKSIIQRLRSYSIYAGWPHIYRPESLLYHSGSGIIFSPDVAKTLLMGMQSYAGEESADIVWGRILVNYPRTVLPFAQITAEDLKSSDDLYKFRIARELLEDGFYLFRIKNQSPERSRELIDPQVQLFLMIESLLLESSYDSKYIAATNEALDRFRRGEGVSIIG